MVGALSGFVAGLVIDVSNLDTLGVTSLLLVLAGYWAGRYGETVQRDRRPGPYLAVVAATVVYAIAGLGLRSILGEAPSPRVVLVDNLFPTVALDVIVAFPHVGPNAERIIALARAHQDADVAGLVESPAHVASWRQSGVRLFIDVNSGMNRTGGTPDAARLIALARKIEEVVSWQPGLEGQGLEGTPTDPRFAYIKYEK